MHTHTHTHTHAHTHINVKHPFLNTRPRGIYKASSHRIGLSQLSVELILVTIGDKMRGTHTVENSNVRCILSYWLMETGSGKVRQCFTNPYFEILNLICLALHLLHVQILLRCNLFL
jgi:hypothetical protein